MTVENKSDDALFLLTSFARQPHGILVRALTQTAFPQPAAYHFGKSHKRGFQLLLTGGIFVVSMLVADRLGITVSPNFRIEPSSSILAAGFTGQRQAPLPKAFFKERIIEAG